MPSVMDAPELMEYVATHDLTRETRERPQPRRARPAFWRTLAQQLTPYLPPTRCQPYAPVCRASRPFETPMDRFVWEHLSFAPLARSLL